MSLHLRISTSLHLCMFESIIMTICLFVVSRLIRILTLSLPFLSHSLILICIGTPCQVGYSTLHSGTINTGNATQPANICSVCAGGYIGTAVYSSTKFLNTGCEICPINTYSSSGNGVSTCSTCTTGYGTLVSGTPGTSLSACDVCVAGFSGISTYNSATTTLEGCVKCDSDQYTPTNGNNIACKTLGCLDVDANGIVTVPTYMTTFTSQVSIYV